MRLDEQTSTHLPHGLDAFLEEVEVTVASKVARSDHVTVETPELLHLLELKSKESERREGRRSRSLSKYPYDGGFVLRSSAKRRLGKET